MNAINRLARMLVAMVLAVGSSTVMTPLWLYQGLFLRQKATKEWPNVLQFILSGVARQTLYFQGILGAQPGPYTRKPFYLENLISPSTSFTWIQPAGKSQKTSNGKQVGFDDSMLPVKLSPKEWNKQTAAYWYRNKRDTSPISKRKSPAVLYFHGGAYITLDPDDVFMGVTGATNQAHYAQVDVLSVAYRLAPASKHPSQLYEAYSAFLHLKNMGYNKIFIGGDSAGANLASTLWRYIEEVAHQSDSVPALLLFSPWFDMKGSQRKGFKKQLRNCTISSAYVEIGFKKMQTNGLPKANDGWISPTYWTAETMKKLPPLFITHGGEETLVEEGIEFIEKAKKNGVQVDHFFKAGYPHDFQMLPWFLTGIRECFTAEGQFIKKNANA